MVKPETLPSPPPRAAPGWAAFPLVLFACTRVMHFGVGWISMRLVPNLDFDPGVRALRAWPALDAFCRWDFGHFALIAREGYYNWHEANFFPVYPMLGRALAWTGIHLNVALLLWSSLATLGAYLCVYRVFLALDGEAAARWGLLLFSAFPFAFFQTAAYPESLMIFLSALAVLLALEGRHLAAGLALGVAVLTRHVAIFTGAALLTAQLRQRPSARGFLLDRALLGLAVPFVFVAGWCLFLNDRFGDPLIFWRARDAWGPTAWIGLGKAWNDDIYFLYLLFSLIPAVGTVLLVVQRRWELASYAVLFLGVIWTVGVAGLGRYSASLWPAYLPLGGWLARRPLIQAPVVAGLWMAQALFLHLFAHHVHIL